MRRTQSEKKYAVRIKRLLDGGMGESHDQIELSKGSSPPVLSMGGPLAFVRHIWHLLFLFFSLFLFLRRRKALAMLDPQPCGRVVF